MTSGLALANADGLAEVSGLADSPGFGLTEVSGLADSPGFGLTEVSGFVDSPGCGSDDTPGLWDAAGGIVSVASGGSVTSGDGSGGVVCGFFSPENLISSSEKSVSELFAPKNSVTS